MDELQLFQGDTVMLTAKIRLKTVKSTCHLSRVDLSFMFLSSVFRFVLYCQMTVPVTTTSE